MAGDDLSAMVFDALNQHLPNEGRRLVRRVEVTKGWGDIHFVTVHSALSRADSERKWLEERVHSIVGGVLHPKRHAVEVRWAGFA
jgi:hypothetical protein